MVNRQIVKLSKLFDKRRRALDTYINLRSTASFELREALLIYSSDRAMGRTDGSAFVTKHAVKLDAKGAPSLLPGSPLGESDIFALIEQLRGAVPSEFLPENVLMRTQETIVWWTPSTIRPMYYVDNKGQELKQLSGRGFPSLPLSFVRAQARWTFALSPPMSAQPQRRRCISRPTEREQQRQRLPGNDQSAARGLRQSLPRWEEAFFESEFTHANASSSLTKHPGGFIGLWKSLIGKKKFPVEHLCYTKETLAQFIK